MVVYTFPTNCLLLSIYFPVELYFEAYDCALENSALAYAKTCSLVASNEGTRQGEGENVHSGPLVTDLVAGAQAVSYYPMQKLRIKGVLSLIN